MQAARQEALDQAVADGAVTQDQADLLEELWAAREDAADGLRRMDLTDEQRAALDAFREEAGEGLLGGRSGPGHRHGRGHGVGGRGPGGDAGEAATDDATVQDSSLDLTT